MSSAWDGGDSADEGGEDVGRPLGVASAEALDRLQRRAVQDGGTVYVWGSGYLSTVTLPGRDLAALIRAIRGVLRQVVPVLEQAGEQGESAEAVAKGVLDEVVSALGGSA